MRGKTQNRKAEGEKEKTKEEKEAEESCNAWKMSGFWTPQVTHRAEVLPEHLRLEDEGFEEKKPPRLVVPKGVGSPCGKRKNGSNKGGSDS